MKLTTAQKEYVKHQIQLELCRKDYLEYVKYVHHGKWFPGKHLVYICNAIQRLLEFKTNKNILIISMPPQHGKSMCLTETLPSYYLGRYPSNRVIEVSYGDDLAQRFGRRNKEKINEFGEELFDISLEKQSDTEFELKVTKGSMVSKGIMAGLTGNPADLIIIDDPIKNRQEAESETYRGRIWDEFINSIYTRLSAKGIIILIMTRWHEDDLAGRLLSSMPNKCLEINIPLVAEEGDILGRKVGDSLFPEIGKDNVWLKDFETVYTSKEGNRSWNALMQGRPTAQEGNMLKRSWWQYYDKIPQRFDEMLQSWDLTFKNSDGSDYVVGQTWGRVNGDKYLLDQIRDRMDFPTTVKAVEAFHERWHPNCILIEDKANGSAVIATLRRKIGGILAINPEGGKIARANAVSPTIESGNVYLPRFAPWLNDFLDECAAFPNGKHDDQVDAMTQVLNRIISTSSSYHEPSKWLKYTREWYAEQNLSKLLKQKRSTEFV